MLTKKKIILMLGFMLCAVALLFCFSQTALADTGDNDGSCDIAGNEFTDCYTGRVEFSSHPYWYFDDIDALLDILKEHEHETKYTIVLYKDLDLKGETLEINKGKNVTFNLGSNKVCSSECDSMFEVKGKLHIIGNNDNHGQYVSNDGSGIFSTHPSIICKDGGSVDAHDVDFKLQYHLMEFKECAGGYNYKFENCNFTSLKNYGSVLNIKDCTHVESLTPITFENCKFNNIDNTAIVNDCDKTLLKILSCKFNNCSSVISASCDESQFIIDNTIIDACNNGDAVYVGNHSDKLTFTFNNSRIVNCKPKESSGGAIEIINSLGPQKGHTFNFNNSTIENCTAEYDGGAIECDADHVNFNFKDSSIKNCRAGFSGGAFFIKGHDVKIDGSKDFFNTGKIEGCHADGCGGAICTSFETNCGNNVTISNFDFIGNSSDKEGGAIKTKGKYNIIYHCNFKDNSSKNEGGAVYGYSGKVWGQDTETQLKYCEFSNNTTTCGKSKSIYLDYWRTCHVQLNLLYYKGDSCDMYTETNIDKKEQNYKDFIEAIKVS